MIAHWDECKEIVKRTLKSETYHFAPLHDFVVHDRKTRIIHCPQHFPDKIMLICAYIVLRDYYYAKFVRNTYNCIKGRGTFDAKNAIERIMRQHPNWYSVQTDIRKFYQRLRHAVVKEDLHKTFKDVHIVRFLDAVIDAFHEGIDEYGYEYGVAIGVNLQQLNAILAMTCIMREINEGWKLPAVEFTDDVWVAVPNKETGHKFAEWYVKRCAERGMEVKPNFRVAPMTETLRMIGYQFRMNKFRQQYTWLNKGMKIRMKRRARRLERMNVSDEYWKQQMASYFGWCVHAQCVNLMRVTFGERFKLFEKNMKTYKEIKENEVGEFGLLKSTRVSVLDIVGKMIYFEDARITQIKDKDKTNGEEKYVEKVAIKFRYVEGDEPVGESTYLLSGSPSLKDRAMKAQKAMPFGGTIIEKSTDGGRRKYYVIS